MSRDFFERVYEALCSDDIGVKQALIKELLEQIDDASNSQFDSDKEPLELAKPSYASIAKIVSAKELPKRKELSSDEGMRALLHAIAHIEFSAIDLALDACYRFRKLPKRFYRDWMVVADDEVRHFRMLSSLLEQIDCSYGELPVHQGLFDISQKTAGALIDRMAVVPRYFEASGLDVNPQIMNRLKSSSTHRLKNDVIDALEVIYNEEIDHVKKGDFWFEYACGIENATPQSRYFEILHHYGLSMRHRPHINVQARKKAGFSCEEILKLGAKSCQ